MDVTTLGFLLFLSGSLLLYYLFADKRKWIVLLLASLLFVATYNPGGLIFILTSAGSIWMAGRRMELVQADSRELLKKKKRRILTAAICFNVGILVILKYCGFLIGTLSGQGNPFSILIPIGLSYYTLQAVGYLLDAYWGRISAEQSFGKLLLFLCYFPQMLQGPISRYRDLSHEFCEKPHPFQMQNLKHGVQLMLWGYFQVFVIGERMAVYVKDLFFWNKTAYGLAAFAGLVFFGVELYCNFSGGIDIVRGASQCFGIELPQNFRQPFFSRSLGEFWRRWHITMGSWMKDYVFYPFSLSKPISRLKKVCKKHMSRRLANRIPIAVANVVVFLLVGIWHGTGTNYALWGLYNGLILAFSELMTEPYARAKTALHIREDSRLWNGFCVARTFFVVTLGWCTDCAATAGGSLRLIGNMLLIHQTNFRELAFASVPSLILSGLLVGMLCCVSVLHEKDLQVRELLDRKNIWVQMLFWLILIQMIALLGVPGTAAGGFMYEDI